MPSTKEKTSLREMMNSYLPSSEKQDEKAHAGVKFIRNLARHILDRNKDIADTEFDVENEQWVGRNIFDFMMNEFSGILNQAEMEAKQKGREVSEADLVKLTPDNLREVMADDVRNRIYEAITSSTTDSI